MMKTKHLNKLKNRELGTILLTSLFILVTLASCERDFANMGTDDANRLSTLEVQDAISLQNDNSLWHFTEKPLATTEQGRLKTSLRAADFDPVGLRATANSAITVVVTHHSISSTIPQLIVGSYDRETVSVHNLVSGVNVITPTHSGDLYVRYASSNPGSGRISVSFSAGVHQIPMYILGKTTHQAWLDMLATDTTSPNVILVGNRYFSTVSKSKAIEFKDEDQDAVISTIDTTLWSMSNFSGLDGSSTQHADRKLKIMVTERPSGYMDATEFRVRIVSTQINRVLQLSSVQTNGWGLYHEFGHHHQMHQWTWNSVVGEVVVNNYTLAARRLVQPNAPGLSAAQWNAVTNYLARPDNTRIYESSAASLITRLAAFYQLYLAFGDDFYQRFHQLYRTSSFSTPNDQAEKELFMINASKVSGYDLSVFFKKWGFTAPQSVYDDMAALGLPAPATDLTLLRD
ncbi:M60 family metallopeptidase [Sphingobacterium griseoflavum]|uniref:Peptidase M60 domain-containing protein n=1 Tax=Sphingobacterium griseoflavum TaxID=1474952 RepID=A0ABQ3HSU0_9SPHI|nr:M60 family metallopeptidase [Sphingobacterium griseoflavum]GHE28577.1 hypothetical protein GCM10017764_08820 [Sphingobacterium griseoflavum]